LNDAKRCIVLNFENSPKEKLNLVCVCDPN